VFERIEILSKKEFPSQSADSSADENEGEIMSPVTDLHFYELSA
jgi:hypothetical protein